MIKKFLLAIVALLLITPFQIFSQPGSPDLNFAGDGHMSFSFGSDGSLGKRVVVGDDGVIWMCGDSWNTAQQMGLAKIMPDGTLDLDFNFDGTIGLNVEGEPATVNDLAIQPDGKIVLVGQGYNGVDHDMAVARVLPDGNIDNSFGGDARVLIDFDQFDTAQDVVIQDDGKILVSGWAYESNTYKFAIARLNDDGSLDPNFGGSGRVISELSAESAAYGMILQPDGKILVCGYSHNGVDYGFALVRYNPDGSLDNSFGTNGVVMHDLGGGFADIAESVALQSDGKIVCGGWSDDQFGLVRFNPDGTPDLSFSYDGVVLTQINDYSIAYELVIQPDGKIVMVGYSFDYDTGISNFALARYETDGLLDSEFGANGILEIDVEDDGIGDIGNGIAMQPDGKIVVSGQSYVISEYNFVLVRILSGLNVGIFEHGLDKIQSYVYPNPIALGQIIEFEYELTEAADVSIKLFDLNGKSFPLFEGYRMSGNQKESLVLPSGLAAGNYTLNIRTDKGMSSIQIDVF